MTCVGGEFKKNNFWTVGHEMNSWKTQKKENIKKEKVVWFELFIPLFFGPVCRFYFPGSPLCFSSRCLHLSVPSFLSDGASVFFCPNERKRTDNEPLLPPLTRPPVCRFHFLCAGSTSCLKLNKNTFEHKQTNSSLSAFTCNFLILSFSSVFFP